MFKPLTWDRCAKAIKKNNERHIEKKEIISYNNFIEFLENVYNDHEQGYQIDNWIVNFGLLDLAISYNEYKKAFTC